MLGLSIDGPNRVLIFGYIQANENVAILSTVRPPGLEHWRTAHPRLTAASLGLTT